MVDNTTVENCHLKNDISFFLGNYVILKSEEGVFALLAHLREVSVLVKKGMKVRAGEKIAKIGNSGNTIQPHLHFQIMKENDLTKAVPIPFVFDRIEIGGGESYLNSRLPRNYQRFRV